MADIQPTTERPFFKPLPEHDTLNAAYFLLRVAEKVTVNAHGCWVWQGAKTNRGYGRIDYGGRKHILHRLLYDLCVSPVQSKVVEVCHNCPGGDNPSCVNPDHLFLGSHTDNMRDSICKGRAKSPPRLRGREKKQAKLNDDDVRSIRRRYIDGEKGVVLAKEFSVSRATISEIVNRKKWAHVSDKVEGDGR